MRLIIRSILISLVWLIGISAGAAFAFAPFAVFVGGRPALGARALLTSAVLTLLAAAVAMLEEFLCERSQDAS